MTVGPPLIGSVPLANDEEVNEINKERIKEDEEKRAEQQLWREKKEERREKRERENLVHCFIVHQSEKRKKRERV